VLGRQLQPVGRRSASNWDLFAEKAKQLLLQDKVAVVFGCWTSVSRKSSCRSSRTTTACSLSRAYEGEECSRNVFTPGLLPTNSDPRRGIPDVEGGRRLQKFYLAGNVTSPLGRPTDPARVPAGQGVPADNIAEEYTPFNHQTIRHRSARSKRFSSGGSAAVLSTINGDSNVPFYKEFSKPGAALGERADMAFSVAEDELRGMDTGALVGHLAAWNYYQSVDAPQNRKFVNAFKEYAQKKNLPGGAKRVTMTRWRPAIRRVHLEAGRREGEEHRRGPRAQGRLRSGVPGPGRQDQDAREQPPRLQARLDRRDPEGRPVQDRVPHQGPRRARAVVEVHDADKGCDWVGHQGRTRRRRNAASARSVVPRVPRRSGAGTRLHPRRSRPRQERALADLTTDDADKREAAVGVLGKTGDPKWIAFLEALREGGVYARKQAGKVQVVVAGAKSTRGDREVVEILSAYDRAALGTVPLAELTLRPPASRKLMAIGSRRSAADLGQIGERNGAQRRPVIGAQDLDDLPVAPRGLRTATTT